MDVHVLINMLTAALLPAVWAAFGPVVTAAVTAWVNTIPKAYVPRPVQLILSSLFTAILAGLTGGMEGLDTGTAAGIGAAMGLGTQTFAAIQPKTLLTSAPEPPKP